MALKDCISVIIPIYNEASRIEKLVRHLKSFDYESIPVEIIVVEARHSTDGGVNLVQGINGVKGIRAEATSRAVQMNAGAAVSCGSVLYFVHADVFPPKDFASRIMEKIEEGMEFGFFNYRFDSDHILLKINSWFTQFDGVFTGGGDQTFFIKKELFELNGGFKDMVLMEDFDFFYRLKKAGNKYCIIPSPALVSSRKYDRNSYVKVNIINGITLLGFKAGVKVEKLKRFYKKWIK